MFETTGRSETGRPLRRIVLAAFMAFVHPKPFYFFALRSYERKKLQEEAILEICTYTLPWDEGNLTIYWISAASISIAWPVTAFCSNDHNLSFKSMDRSCHPLPGWLCCLAKSDCCPRCHFTHALAFKNESFSICLLPLLSKFWNKRQLLFDTVWIVVKTDRVVVRYGLETCQIRSIPPFPSCACKKLKAAERCIIYLKLF